MAYPRASSGNDTLRASPLVDFGFESISEQSHGHEIKVLESSKESTHNPTFVATSGLEQIQLHPSWRT